MTDGPSPEQRLLERTDTVAVVGLSRSAERDSHIVARHLLRRDYEVIPVHPKADEILDQQAYPSLSALPDELAEEVDVVNVFRPADEVPGILDEALEALPDVAGLWTQKGIVHEEAAERAREHGLTVVQDRCIRTQDLYRRFSGSQEATANA
jgi:predicted CoA-binding protein